MNKRAFEEAVGSSTILQGPVRVLPTVYEEIGRQTLVFTVNPVEACELAPIHLGHGPEALGE